MSHVTW